MKQHFPWVGAPKPGEQSGVKWPVEVQLDEGIEDPRWLVVYAIPELHAGNDDRAHPEHRLLAELGHVCDQFVHGALAPVEFLVRLIHAEL